MFNSHVKRNQHNLKVTKIIQKRPKARGGKVNYSYSLSNTHPLPPFKIMVGIFHLQPTVLAYCSKSATGFNLYYLVK